MEHIHIVTVANKAKYYFDYLKESCKNNGKNLEIIGFGEEWLGYNWKFKKMIQYLNNLNPNDIVCFVDGFDVICVRNLNNLKNDFLKIKSRENCKIIIGFEQQIQLTNKIMANLFFGKCKDLSINSGTYIGYAKDLLDILTKTYELNPDTKGDDQLMITKYCNLNPNDVYIDDKCELFLTIVNYNDELDEFVQIQNNQVVYNNNKPYFIHAPSCTYLDNIIIKLGYSYNTKIKDIVWKDYSTDKIFKQSFNIIYQIKDDLYLIFLVIILILLIYTKKK